MGDFENRSEPTLVGSLYGVQNSLVSMDSSTSYAKNYLA
jgi:hypothetical protein